MPHRQMVTSVHETTRANSPVQISATGTNTTAPNIRPSIVPTRVFGVDHREGDQPLAAHQASRRFLVALRGDPLHVLSRQVGDVRVGLRQHEGAESGDADQVSRVVEHRHVVEQTDPVIGVEPLDEGHQPIVAEPGEQALLVARVQRFKHLGGSVAVQQTEGDAHGGTVEPDQLVGDVSNLCGREPCAEPFCVIGANQFGHRRVRHG